MRLDVEAQEFPTAHSTFLSPILRKATRTRLEFATELITTGQSHKWPFPLVIEMMRLRIWIGSRRCSIRMETR